MRSTSYYESTKTKTQTGKLSWIINLSVFVTQVTTISEMTLTYWKINLESYRDVSNSFNPWGLSLHTAARFFNLTIAPMAAYYTCNWKISHCRGLIYHGRARGRLIEQGFFIKNLIKLFDLDRIRANKNFSAMRKDRLFDRTWKLLAGVSKYGPNNVVRVVLDHFSRHYIVYLI